MRFPRLYTTYCLLVLMLFSYSKYRGLDFGSDTSGNGTGGWFHYVGTSSSFHK